MRQISKYILSSMHHYSMSVVIVALLWVTDSDCGCPHALVDVIATHCYSHRQLKSSHYEFL